jgi:hypothetical protein
VVPGRRRDGTVVLVIAVLLLVSQCGTDSGSEIVCRTCGATSPFGTGAGKILWSRVDPGEGRSTCE